MKKYKFTLPQSKKVNSHLSFPPLFYPSFPGKTMLFTIDTSLK